MNLVRGRAFWPTSEAGPLLPSIAKRMPGRPPKKKREPLEAENKSKKRLTRAGRIFKCRLCKKEGHNMRGCPHGAKDSVNLLIILFSV